jgi:hypothetical protein
MGDVRLRLAFEESLVAALAETGGGVHDEFGVGAEWDAAVAGQVVSVGWRPLHVRLVALNLEMNQVVLATVMARHRRERLPINAFFVNAQAAPGRFVSENLVRELVDPGTCLARASVTGDEPAATELIAFPRQSTKTSYAPSLSRGKQEPCRQEYKSNSADEKDVLRIPHKQFQVWRKRDRAERHEIELHGHALPIR